MKKKILIIGATSYAGFSFSMFCKKIKSFSTYLVYRRKSNVYYAKIIKKNFKKKQQIILKDYINSKEIIKKINKIKPEIIIDFLSICDVNNSWKKPQTFFQVNVNYKLDIIKKIDSVKFIKKFIYISTPEIFGNTKIRTKENNNNFSPSTPYAISKLTTELLLKSYFKHKKFPAIITRFSNFFGEHQQKYRLVPALIKSIKKNKYFYLDGKGDSLRNFIFTDDFCDAILRVIKKGKLGETYHFSGKQFKTIKEYISIAQKTLIHNKKIKIKHRKERIGKDKKYLLCTKYTNDKLGWSAKVNFNQAILKLYK